MWIENDVFKEDLEYLMNCDFIPWNNLEGKSILVTGATGLIGYTLVSGLIYANITKRLQIRIFALVRDLEKAHEKYKGQLLEENHGLMFVVGDVENMPNITDKIDYIIHGASPTASKFFVDKPVETIKTSVCGTINLLDIARKHNVDGFVYMSSMEVYGSSDFEKNLNENDLGYINPLVVRNCYPESKRMCESLIASYASEYGIKAMNVRLAQTFGPGVDYNDGRVFAEFARCAIEKKDIVLLTDGSSKRCYLYTMDAVSAILTILLKGESGQAYNVANPETYCSVKEMAEMVKTKIANNDIHVIIMNDKEKSKKFTPPHYYNLDVSSMYEKGWKASISLIDSYKRLIITLGEKK